MGTLWTKNHPEEVKAYRKKWRCENKLKIAAHQAFRDRIRRALNPELLKSKHAEWSASHQDHLRAYRLRTKDRLRQTSKAWQEKNKVRWKASIRKWNQEHRSERNAANKAWRDAHPEQVKGFFRKYRRTHPLAWRKSDAVRRARKLNANTGNLETIAAWESRWRSKKRAKCFWCQQPFSPSDCHTDHIIALSRGGIHSVENLCVSCAHCNQTKSDKELARWNESLARPVLLL